MLLGSARAIGRHGTTQLKKANHSLVKRFVILTASLLLLLCLVAGGVALWLATRTIDISRFAPRIAAELATAAPGLRVTFGTISARREPLRGVVEVDIRGSQLQHPKLTATAHVEAMRVDLALLPLLRGKIQVRAVTVRGLRASTALSLADLFKTDTQQSARTLPWAPGLKSVQLEDVQLGLRETDFGTTINVQLPTLAAYQNLFGGDVRLAGQLTLANTSGVIPLTLKATATPDGPWQGEVRAELARGLGLARALQPKLAMPDALPQATLIAKLRQQQKLAADITLELGPGAIVWPAYYARPLQVKRLTAQAKWREDDSSLVIPAATLLVDTLKLRASGAIDLKRLDRSHAVASFEKLSPRQLVSLWPAKLGGGGRRWINANILGGEIRDGRLHLKPGGKLIFDFGMHDLRATYRTPMPPLINAFGTGRLTEKGLTLDLTQGSINDLAVTPARVVIEDWAVSPNMMRVDMGMRGDLPKLLAVLDSKPLGFISRYGVVPATTQGMADGRLNLRFPLIDALRTEQIDIQAQAQTRNSMVPDVYAGRALHHAELDFDINGNGMLAVGKGLIGPQPISLRWSEDFTGTKAAPSHYEIKAQSSVAMLALLDIDMTSLASGPLDVDIDLAMKGPTMVHGMFRADARQTSFDMPMFGQVKPPGVAATVSGAMIQRGQQLIINDLSVASAPVTLRATARVPLVNGRSEFDIEQFVYGRNRLSGSLTFGDGGPVGLQIYGGTFDAKPFLRKFSSRLSSPASVTPPSSLRTEIAAKLDTVEMMGDINLKNLTTQATISGDTLTRLLAAGKVGGTSDVKAELISNGTVRVLTMSAADAGQMGRALDLFKAGQGGAFDLVANIKGSNATLAINGRGQVRNMRVADTPVMARMLTLASLTGLRDMATGRGILFENIDVPFKFQRGIIDISAARAIGPGLGLTLEGQMQQSLAALNLRGVIIPSYTLNAAVGKIPILGTVLTGGKGQGLIGFNYRITGSAAVPKVDVQASSGLALGPLRRLLQGKAAEVAAPAR